MASVDVKESWSDTALGTTVTPDAVHRRATRKFSALVSVSVGPAILAAENAIGIPNYGDAYPGDPWLLVTDKRITTKSPNLFEVLVTYTQELGVDPTTLDPDIEWDAMEIVEAIDTDADGKPIQNINGEGADPSLTREGGELTLSISRNEAAFNALLADTYFGCINSDSFLGFPAGTVLLKRIRARTVKKNGVIQYWRVSYIFHLRHDGWKARVIHEGFKTRVLDEDGNLITENGGPVFNTIKDHDGTPLNEPVKLTMRDITLPGGGTLVAGMEMPLNVDAHWLEFKRYPEKSFTPLNLV